MYMASVGITLIALFLHDRLLCSIKASTQFLLTQDEYVPT